MADTILADQPQTVELLQSMARLIEWLRGVPATTRRQLADALAECSDETRATVSQTLDVLKDPRATPPERQQALATIADALSLRRDDLGTDSQQAAFADRLRELMNAKRVTQQELAERVGCSQPAVSQMLNRTCRPHKKTIFKIAEALKVQPQDLWPDIEVADMLDGVASFQQDDYVMTAAEADALRPGARRSGPKIPVRAVPSRQRPRGNE
jgi:transcriptional regulator with XRE-family HTH domain